MTLRVRYLGGRTLGWSRHQQRTLYERKLLIGPYYLSVGPSRSRAGSATGSTKRSNLQVPFVFAQSQCS